MKKIGIIMLVCCGLIGCSELTKPIKYDSHGRILGGENHDTPFYNPRLPLM